MIKIILRYEQMIAICIFIWASLFYSVGKQHSSFKNSEDYASTWQNGSLLSNGEDFTVWAKCNRFEKVKIAKQNR